MHAVFAVELRVELFLAIDPVLIEEHRRALRPRCDVAEVFDDNHDRRFLIHLAIAACPGAWIGKSAVVAVRSATSDTVVYGNQLTCRSDSTKQV